ncbi:MAG: ROK family protein [Actinomycetota bacterium]|nr:ROK family protein [Actinomycetota bacterium]
MTSGPLPAPRPNGTGTAGAILDLVRNGHAATRSDLASITGLARSTIAQRVDALLASQLLVPGGDRASTGGRPPTVLTFNGDAGIVLAGDIGATHSRVAVCDLTGTMLAEHSENIAVADGPDVVLSWVEEAFAELLRQSGRKAGALRGVGVGLPGPVEFATGRPVTPPIMPGWHLHPVGQRLSERFGVPALVDNDVNMMAVGEHWTHWRDEPLVMFVKIGTGIGCGYVAGGHVQRGADGAAGDIGHIHVPDHDDPASAEVVCRCGNVGCLEAIAGGGALATRLRALGLPTETSRDVVDQVLAGQPEAVRAVRRAGHTIGGVLATCVNVLNPAVIVIGGDVARAGEVLLAGIREVVYKRSLPLATGRLRIVGSQLDDEAGVIGAAVTVLETVLAPAAIDAALELAKPA